MYVFAEILISTSAIRPRADVAYCLHALARRLAKTHNWTVCFFCFCCVKLKSFVRVDIVQTCVNSGSNRVWVQDNYVCDLRGLCTRLIFCVSVCVCMNFSRMYRWQNQHFKYAAYLLFLPVCVMYYCDWWHTQRYQYEFKKLGAGRMTANFSTNSKTMRFLYVGIICVKIKGKCIYFLKKII